MRKQFAGYYTPTDDEFKAMWQDGTFSVDANVLLNLYRYTKPTRDRLLEILERLRNRIRLTNQAAYEFHKNRLTVISQQQNAYDSISGDFTKNLADTLSRVKQQYSKHSGLDVPALEILVRESTEKVTKLLQEAKNSHPDLLAGDDILQQVTTLFDGLVGEPYSEDDLAKKHKLAENRFVRKQPPGYEDAKSKSDPDKYGDAVVWFQLLNFAQAQQTKNPIVFITDDKKEDWWHVHRGQTIGPRPELVHEMLVSAGVTFYMYTPERFMTYAETYLNLPKQADAIEEVREVSQVKHFTTSHEGGHVILHRWISSSSFSNQVQNVGDGDPDDWTEFWDWAETSGLENRSQIDAFLGYSTKGLTADQLRNAIVEHPEKQRKAEWDRLITWLRTIGINNRSQLLKALGGSLEGWTPDKIRERLIADNADIDF